MEIDVDYWIEHVAGDHSLGHITIDEQDILDAAKRKVTESAGEGDKYKHFSIDIIRS